MFHFVSKTFEFIKRASIEPCRWAAQLEPPSGSYCPMNSVGCQAFAGIPAICKYLQIHKSNSNRKLRLINDFEIRATWEVCPSWWSNVCVFEILSGWMMNRRPLESIDYRAIIFSHMRFIWILNLINIACWIIYLLIVFALSFRTDWITRNYSLLFSMERSVLWICPFTDRTSTQTDRFRAVHPRRSPAPAERVHRIWLPKFSPFLSFPYGTARNRRSRTSSDTPEHRRTLSERALLLPAWSLLTFCLLKAQKF